MCVNNAKSSAKNIPAGVPQGAVLSPTLYSLYISDFVPRRGTDIALYADDMGIAVKGKLSNAIVHKLGKCVQICKKYYNKWKIKIKMLLYVPLPSFPTVKRQSVS